MNVIIIGSFGVQPYCVCVCVCMCVCMCVCVRINVIYDILAENGGQCNDLKRSMVLWVLFFNITQKW